MYDGSAIVKMMMKMTVVGWDIGDDNDKDDGSLNKTIFFQGLIMIA